MAFHRQAATGCNLGLAAAAVLEAAGQLAVEIGMVQGGEEDIGSSVTTWQEGTTMDMGGGGEMGEMIQCSAWIFTRKSISLGVVEEFS